MYRKLLWIDGLAGLFVGLMVVILGRWLCELYRLPLEVVYFVGGANLLYGLYSISLASRANRPKIFILFLIAANLTWAVVCMGLFVAYRQDASLFGHAHLIGEGLFVSGLASLEWRWRELLQTA